MKFRDEWRDEWRENRFVALSFQECFDVIKTGGVSEWIPA
jgi:hypothetical protein